MGFEDGCIDAAAVEAEEAWERSGVWDRLGDFGRRMWGRCCGHYGVSGACDFGRLVLFGHVEEIEDVFETWGIRRKVEEEVCEWKVRLEA